MQGKPAHTHRQYAEEIVRLLASHNLSARVVALRLLHTATPEAVNELLDMARAGGRRARYQRAAYLISCIAGTLLLGATVLVYSRDNLRAVPLMQIWFVCALGLAALNVPVSSEVVDALLRIDDPRAIGPIAEALDRSSTRWVAEEVLIRLLPLVMASDSGQLSEEQLACLYRNLRRKNPRFVLACLFGLQQIGDESALPHVKRLAELTGRRPYTRQIRETAQASLAYLEDRLTREHDRRTLLRPAGEAADFLPRPSFEPTDPLPRSARKPTDDLLRVAPAPIDRLLHIVTYTPESVESRQALLSVPDCDQDYDGAMQTAASESER
jgi:hypothetical protein